MHACICVCVCVFVSACLRLHAGKPTCISDLMLAKCVSMAPPWGKLHDMRRISSQKQLYARASARTTVSEDTSSSSSSSPDLHLQFSFFIYLDDAKERKNHNLILITTLMLKLIYSLMHMILNSQLLHYKFNFKRTSYAGSSNSCFPLLLIIFVVVCFATAARSEPWFSEHRNPAETATHRTSSKKSSPALPQEWDTE